MKETSKQQSGSKQSVKGQPDDKSHTGGNRGHDAALAQAAAQRADAERDAKTVRERNR